MDAFELFRKLSTGVKFDKRRFQADAERFQLVKKQSESKLDNERAPDVDDPVSRKKRKRDEVEKETGDKIVFLGGMSTTSVNNDKKRRKSLTDDEKQMKLEREKVNRFRNANRISVTGNGVPRPISEFIELSTSYDLPDKLIDNIINCGYRVPTPIQMQALPIMLQGRQILACAPTGSGKTAAFLLPVIHRLGGPQKKGFRAVVLSPTRELAAQTYRECIRLGQGFDFRVHIISKANQALNKYGPKSSQKFDILITTPKRILYLLNQDPPAISFNNVEWLIVDEADKLFEDGTRCFKDQLEAISKACTNENLKTAMFSATSTAVVAKWCRRNLKRLVTVTVGHRNAATDTVDQELLFVGAERGKLVALRNIIQKGILPPVLVFVQSKERAQELFNELIFDGINVDAIHSDRTQTQRDNVVRCFREGKIWVLICTELMARGIDFKGVNLVVNYDFPPSAISYVHRIGRTGRAGHKGKAITFFTKQDTANLRSIATVMRDSGCDVPKYMLDMKKHSKKERRRLERAAPAREEISTIPSFKRLRDKERRLRKRKSEDGKVSKEKAGKQDTIEKQKKRNSKKYSVPVNKRKLSISKK